VDDMIAIMKQANDLEMQVFLSFIYELDANEKLQNLRSIPHFIFCFFTIKKMDPNKQLTHWASHTWNKNSFV
jgi:hypothetical protein